MRRFASIFALAAALQGNPIASAETPEPAPTSVADPSEATAEPTETRAPNWSVPYRAFTTGPKSDDAARLAAEQLLSNAEGIDREALTIFLKQTHPESIHTLRARGAELSSIDTERKKLADAQAAWAAMVEVETSEGSPDERLAMIEPLIAELGDHPIALRAKELRALLLVEKSGKRYEVPFEHFKNFRSQAIEQFVEIREALGENPLVSRIGENATLRLAYLHLSVFERDQSLEYFSEIALSPDASREGREEASVQAAGALFEIFQRSPVPADNDWELIHTLLDAVEETGENPENIARARLMRMLAFNWKHDAHAMIDYEPDFREKVPADLFPREFTTGIMLVGIAFSQIQQPLEAIKRYDEIIALHPDLDPVWTERGPVDPTLKKIYRYRLEAHQHANSPDSTIAKLEEEIVRKFGSVVIQPAMEP